MRYFSLPLYYFDFCIKIFRSMKPAILKRTGELSPEIFNPFFTFFDFAYYLLLSPIRFSKTLQIPYEVKLHSSTIHSILVNIFLFMGYFLLTNNVRRSLGKSTTSKSPLFYFDILLPVVNIIIRIIFQVTFFKNKDKILHLFQLITKYRYILPRGKLPFFYRKCLSVLIGLGVTLTCFADFANLLRTNYFPYANANLTAYENFINGGRAMLFLASREHQGSEDAMDTVIVVLTSIAVVSGLLLGFYQNVVVFCGVHMVWTLSKFFRDSMNRLVDMETSKNGRLWVNECSQDEREKWEKVNSQYNCIKEICEAFSDAFGSMLMCYLVLTIIGDSRYIDHLLFSPEPHFILSVGTFVLSSTASLILAAEVTLNLESIKTWLSVDFTVSKYFKEEANAIINELNDKEVGVKVANRFTVTYTVLWNVFSSVVTYFVICLQSKSSNKA